MEPQMDADERGQDWRPGMETAREKLNRITEIIIGCAYKVSNTLGVGFLEKVYENALAHELHKHGLRVRQQSAINVVYDGAVVGDYFADVVVENCVVVELKVVEAVDDIHLAQCLNYLKATGYRVCILLNFNESRVAVRRIVNRF